MRYRILMSELAEQDIDRIREHITYVFLDPVTAERMVEQIRLKIKSLVIFPERNKIGQNLYKASVKNYRIVYRVKGNTIDIVRVLHVRQLLGKQLGDNC